MKAAFGSRQQTDPIAHLLDPAAGWGGLPQDQALYLGVEPGLPAGHYSLMAGTCRCAASGRSASTTATATSSPTSKGAIANSITAVPNHDGSVTVKLGGDPGLPNQIPVMDGSSQQCAEKSARARASRRQVDLPAPRPAAMTSNTASPTLHVLDEVAATAPRPAWSCRPVLPLLLPTRLKRLCHPKDHGHSRQYPRPG